jgi:hypothetical protein
MYQGDDIRKIGLMIANEHYIGFWKLFQLIHSIYAQFVEDIYTRIRKYTNEKIQ